MVIDRKIMDIDEVCVYLQLSKSTVYKLAQEGRIPCQKVGRNWRFNRDFIDQWIANPDQLTDPTHTPVSPRIISQTPRPSAQPNPTRSVNVQSSVKPDLFAKFFTPSQRTQLQTYSITSLASLLMLLVTDHGKKELAQLLKISVEEVEQIAVQITREMNDKE